ncbi:FxsA family protein [Candidatus Methylocalor cossyra]|uniref:FxsA cytoplasmic membrane protein n=1 Tax=Candidatus Methylocalor cossyra TaxID=3108543 RepID=A0ABM9NE81_9GAMM
MNIRPGLPLAMLGLLVLELYLQVKLIGALGWLATFALLIGAGMAGLALLRAQGGLLWLDIQRGLAQGELPTRPLVEGALVAAGGALLVMPGLLSDALALLCLIPVSRRWLASFLLKNAITPRPAAAESDSNLVIDGEYRRER